MQQPSFDGVPALQPASPTHQPAAAGTLTTLAEHFLARRATHEFDNSCEEFDASELFRPIYRTGMPYVPPPLARGEDIDQLHVSFRYVEFFCPTNYLYTI
jgi:hypothetical protein